MERPAFYTTQEIAKRLGIHPQTLRRWEREGVIPPVTRRRGQRVYTPTDLDRIEAAVMTRPLARKEV